MRPLLDTQTFLFLPREHQIYDIIEWIYNHPEYSGLAIIGLLIVVILILGLTSLLIRRVLFWIPLFADASVELLRSLGQILAMPRIPGIPHQEKENGRSDVKRSHYLRIRPTSNDYEPSLLVSGLDRLHEKSITSRMASILPWIHPKQNELEVIIASRGSDRGVKFYIGGTAPLNRLESFLSYGLAGFDVDPVETNLESLLGTADGSRTKIDLPASAKSEISQRIADGGGSDINQSVLTDGPPDNSRTRARSSSDNNPPEDTFQKGNEKTQPIVYRIGSRGDRSGDWILTRKGLTDMVRPIDDKQSGPLASGPHPMVPAIEALHRMDDPAAVIIQAKSTRSCGKQVDRRMKRLREGTDSILGRVFGFFDHNPNSRNYSSDSRYRSKDTKEETFEISKADKDRIENLDQSARDLRWSANLWLCGVPSSSGSASTVSSQLKSLWKGFLGFESGHYQLSPPPSASVDYLTSILKIRSIRNRQRFSDILAGRITMPVLGRSWFGLRRTWPDIVCTSNELAGLTAIPSLAALTPDVKEQIDHRPTHSETSPQLTPTLRERYTDPSESGIRIADLDSRLAEDDPHSIYLSSAELTRHLISLGATGTGKTTDQASRAIDAAINTTGPVILIVGPGANVGSYVVRGLIETRGRTWTEEKVHWFKFPEAIPGLTVLDVSDQVDRHPDIMDRWDAIQQVRDRTINLLREIMGPDRFDDANYAKQVVDDLISAAFDPEYWYENTGDPFRSSKDRCRFSHLSAMMTEMEQHAGSKQAVTNRPRSSRKDLDDRLKRYATSDPRSLAAIGNGVHNRLDLIAGNDRRLLLFDNTEQQFSFDDAIDTDNVYIFDLSALESQPQRLMTLILATKLYDALRAGQSKLGDRSDDYVVNLFVDEAAHLIGFQYLSKLLSEGRNYGIGLDLATQFVEQFEEKADHEALLNILNNTHTKIFATHDIDERLARYCRPEGMAISEFRHLVRDMPNAQRVVLLPSQDDVERPQSFTADRGPLPSWHPANESCPIEPDEFDALRDSIIQRTKEEYGLPAAVREGVRSGWSKPVLPTDLTRKLGLRRQTDIDVAIALMTAHAQASKGERDSNGWVSSRQVCDHLVSWAERSEKHEQLNRQQGSPREDAIPSHVATTIDEPDPGVYSDLLDKITDNPDGFIGSIDTSIYLECASFAEIHPSESTSQSDLPNSLSGQKNLTRGNKAPGNEQFDIEATAESTPDGDQVYVRLTDHGESIADELDSSGDSGASGSPEHDAMLQAAKRVLLENGFEVDIITQGWKSVPDAVAFLPSDDTPVELAVEVERSSIKRPDKMLTNFKRALETGRIMLTVIESDDTSKGQRVTQMAERIERIFENPVNGQLDDCPRYYNYSHKTISFDGGASTDGATAVRPIGDDGDRTTVWVNRGGENVLFDGEGTEYASISDFDNVSRKQFPACYTYDRKGVKSETGPYAVHKRNGKTVFYDTKEDFHDDWVTVKRPFVPEYEFPYSDIDRDSFAILVLGDFEPHHEAAIFRRGELYPISALREAVIDGAIKPMGNSRDLDGCQSDTSGNSGIESHKTEPETDDREQSKLDRDALPGGSHHDGERTQEFWSQCSRGEPQIAAPRPDIQTKAGGVYHFTREFLTDDCSSDESVPFRDIHERYLRDARERGYPAIDHAPVFSRYLKENLSFTTEKRYVSGKTTRETVCVGLKWREQEP